MNIRESGQKLLWFAGLWLGGVVAISLVGLLIKWALSVN